MAADSTPRASRPGPRDYFLAADNGSGLLPWGHVTEAMSQAKNYWVATSGEGGRPHCMPVWGVWLEDRLVFSTSPVSRKARNLAKNPFAVVHLESGDQVVVVEGRVREVRGRERLEGFLEAYNPKYAWDFTMDQLAHGGVYEVTPDRAFAWLGSRGEAFSGTATRWVFP